MGVLGTENGFLLLDAILGSGLRPGQFLGDTRMCSHMLLAGLFTSFSATCLSMGSIVPSFNTASQTGD